MFTFIDVFAGCGGLSLGLMQAGGKGAFAIERNPSAFATLSHNLLGGNRDIGYDWPGWLPRTPHDIRHVLRDYGRELRSLRGSIDAVVGGPPCQGFSLNGARNEKDPRNQLFRHYLRLVELVRPAIVLLENVRGIDVPFSATGRSTPRKRGGAPRFSERIRQRLQGAGYHVYPTLLCAGDFQIPQLRSRFFLLGVSALVCTRARYSPAPFSDLPVKRAKYFAQLGIQPGRRVSVKEAISDLECRGKKLVPCPDSPEFMELDYQGPRTEYQRQMHERFGKGHVNSMRLAKHRPETQRRFRQILKNCPRGVQLSEKDRQRFGLTKHRTHPLDPRKPAPTLTTLPDDVLHYAEPRILTVREYARLQSFPDWFEFKGKYGTGGLKRRVECPRYTQVGNAVPVRLARFLGFILSEIGCSIRGRTSLEYARKAA